MVEYLTKQWKRIATKLTGRFHQNSDPHVQLQQAIADAQNQHRRLKEQAANVIASQKQAEIRLNKKMADLEKLYGNARQALTMADDAERTGDTERATQYTQAAETIADKLISVEKDVESLKAMVLETTEASDQAKAAVSQDSRLLREKIAEKSRLLSQPEQAEMREEINSAMSRLTETVGDDVPTLNEITEKIEARYARAKASTELGEAGLERRVLEVEQATANVEAQGRLAEIRAELSLDASAQPAAVEGSVADG